MADDDVCFSIYPQMSGQHIYYHEYMDYCPFGSRSTDIPLDLSIHHTFQPFGNRFSVFATPTCETPTDSKPPREFAVNGRYRRSRNSRGSKEAKRRRDARRSKRKQAAQMIDQQLLRDVGVTLGASQLRAGTGSGASTTASTAQHADWLSIWSMHTAQFLPTPPLLPELYFQYFEPSSLDELQPAADILSPPKTPTLLPSWCPQLPSLMHIHELFDDLPILYHLSSLSEPKDVTEMHPANGCRKLEVWRPKITTKPKRSRFFPPLRSNGKPVVKLPPTASKLHTSHSSSSQHAALTLTYAEAVKVGMAEAKPSSQGMQTIYSAKAGGTAANLWRILKTPCECAQSEVDPDVFNSHSTVNVRLPQATHALMLDHLPAVLTPTSENDHGVNNDTYFRSWQICVNMDEASAELEGSPQVHANSLTGLGAEITMLPYTGERSGMHDSGTCLTALPSPPMSFKELVLDPDFGEPVQTVTSNTMKPPDAQYPTLSAVSNTYLLTDVLSINSLVDREHVGSDAIDRLDAQFRSEQALFSQPSTTPSITNSSASTDIAAFLKMGHAKDCWCNDCGIVEGPRAPLTQTVFVETPELVATDTFIEIDDDWMLYSAVEELIATPNTLREPHTPTPASMDDFEGWSEQKPFPVRHGL